MTKPTRPANFTPPPDGSLVGVAELGWWLNVSDRRTYVSRWVAGGKLPPAFARLAMGPVWVVDKTLREAVETITAEYTPR